MSDPTSKCPICDADSEVFNDRYSCYHIRCPKCIQPFGIGESDRNACFNPKRKSSYSQSDRAKFSGLLRERSLRRSGKILLYESTPGEIETQAPVDSVKLSDLLNESPSGVLELLDRSLSSLITVAADTDNGFAQLVEIDAKQYQKFFPLCVDWNACMSVYRLMSDRGWIKVFDNSGHIALTVTAPGWERYEERMRQSDQRNPVFVAMWFGTPRPDDVDQTDRREERKRLFDKYIEPACGAHGWKAKRADTDEHNDPIMDRVIADIRKAPFVIADLETISKQVLKSIIPSVVY